MFAISTFDMKSVLQFEQGLKIYFIRGLSGYGISTGERAFYFELPTDQLWNLHFIAFF